MNKMKQIKIKRDEPISPIVFLRAPKAQIKTLDLVKADMMNYIGTHGESISRLTLAVNDSASGKLFDDVYTRDELLGEGGFAFVYRCTHKVRNHQYAVKQIDAENYDCGGSNIKEELNALKKLKEVPYIVKLLDVFVEPNRTCLVMEEMVGGDLLDKIYEKEIYSEPDARILSRRLLEAIYFCHRKKIVHRDIKPENILLVNKDDDTNIKLGDFGCAKYMDTTNPFWEGLTTLCGSPQYVAPELYTHTDGYNHMCDLWSVGIVLYVILGGYAPFEAPTRELPELICEGYVEFHKDYWSKVSSRPKYLISNLLQVDISKRWNTKQALDCEWLRRRDKDLTTDITNTFGTGDNNNNSISTFEAWLQRQNESSSHVSFDSNSYRGNGGGGGRRNSFSLNDGSSHHSKERNGKKDDDNCHEEGDVNNDNKIESQKEQQEEKVPATISSSLPTTTTTTMSKEFMLKYNILLNDDDDDDSSDSSSDSTDTSSDSSDSSDSSSDKEDAQDKDVVNDNHNDDNDSPSSPPPIIVGNTAAIAGNNNNNSQQLRSNTIDHNDDEDGGDADVVDATATTTTVNVDNKEEEDDDDDDDEKNNSQQSLTVDDLK